MKRVAVALTIVLAAAAAGAGAWSRASHDAPTEAATSAAPETSNTEAPGAPSARDGALPLDLSLGRSFAYELTSRTAIVDARGREVGTSGLSGRLALTVVGAEEGNAAVRAELTSDARASAPFFFLVRADGSIAGFGFPKALSGDTRRMLRTAIENLQLVRRGDAPAWESIETDSTGDFVAAYTTSDRDRITKRKLRYERVRTPEGLVTPASIGGRFEIEGGVTATLDASGWPAQLDADERVSSTFSALRLTARSKTQLRLVEKGERRDLAGSYEAAKASFDPDVDGMAEAEKLASENADRGLVAGASFTTLASALERTPEGRERGRLVARLGALFRLDPEAIASARTKLLAEDTPESVATGLAAALGSVGSPAAQRALGDAVRSPHTSVATKTEASISLGLASTPTAEAKKALQEASRSSETAVAGTSLLALGNLAHASAQAGSPAADVVDDLLSRLRAAASPEEAELVLRALGNAGDDRAVDAVLTFVRSPDASLRAAAASALRGMSDPRAIDALRVALFDADARVQSAALGAVGQRDIVPFIDALALLLQRDDDREVRLLAIHVMARSLQAVPELESILASTATRDADESVRAAATNALSRTG